MSQDKLLASIYNNDLCGIIEAIDEGYDVNLPDNMITPLCAAISAKCKEEIIVELIRAGAAVRREGDSEFYCPLMCALDSKCDESIIFRLISAGASLNYSGFYGMTPLIYAIKLRYKEVIYRLVSAGADVNYYCQLYGTPLLYALDNSCDESVISYLVNAGADVNLCDNDQTSPLMYALWRNYCVDVIELLIKKGANVNARASVHHITCQTLGVQNCYDHPYFVDCVFMRTPLMFMACYKYVSNYRFNSFKQCGKLCVNNKNALLLLKNGADVSCTDSNGDSVLHYRLCSQLIELLVEWGARLEVRNCKKETPLMKALHTEMPDVIETFLTLGSKPNCSDVYLNYPLHYPLDGEVADLLVYYGADLNALNKCQDTPLRSLVRKQSTHKSILIIVKHFILIGEHDKIADVFQEVNINYQGCLVTNEYIECCKKEVELMKTNYLYKELTFFNFCKSKLRKSDTVVGIPSNLLCSMGSVILDMFPCYCDIIFRRLRFNSIESHRNELMKFVEKLRLTSLDENHCHVELNYDCLYEVCRYLTVKQVLCLIKASLHNNSM